jgi:hypothetical protein
MMNSRVRSRPARGARLVALLDLEVVEDLRQVAVGAHERGDVEGDDLLVGHGQDHVGAAAVLEPELLVEAVAPRLLPQLGGVQHGHQQLLAADRVHLLADDLLRLAMGAPARRQPGPQTRAELPDQPGPDHQLVGEGLRVGGGLLLGRSR